MDDLNVIKNLLFVIAVVVSMCLVLIIIFLDSIDKSTQQIVLQLLQLSDDIEALKDRTPTLEECVSLTNSVTKSIDALVKTNQAILANSTNPQQRKPRNERKTNKVKA